MESEKGISLVSLIIYLIAVTIAVGIIARISSYFYKNMDTAIGNTSSEAEFVKFNTYFTKEINNEGNYVKNINSDGTYIIFKKTNHQYTFLDNAIYMDKIKICTNVERCSFSSNDNKNVKVDLLINKKSYVNVYTVSTNTAKTFKNYRLEWFKWNLENVNLWE